MIILVKPSQFILSNPLQAHKHFITLHHQLYNLIPSSTDTSNIYIHNKARIVNLSFSIDIFKKLIRIQLVMVYEMQGCQFIRPDSVNLSGLNDYNISSDQRSSTWMHHEQLHLYSDRRSSTWMHHEQLHVIRSEMAALILSTPIT